MRRFWPLLLAALLCRSYCAYMGLWTAEELERVAPRDGGAR